MALYTATLTPAANITTKIINEAVLNPAISTNATRLLKVVFRNLANKVINVYSLNIGFN